MPNGIKTEWSPQDQRLIELLAAGVRQVDAAKEIGVSAVTVSKRCARPEFRKAVRALVALRLEAGNRILISHYTAAVETLVDLLEDDNPQIRHRAAESILKHSAAAGEFDVVQRMDELEAALQNAQQGGRNGC